MAQKIFYVNQIDDFHGNFFFLSNFAPSEITYEGIVYPTVEHAFQAAKTFDTEERKVIAAAKTPNAAKAMGRKVNLRKDWEDVKEQVMYECVKAKFKIPHLRMKLLNTKNVLLIEGNTWHDNIWGDCKCDKCKNKKGKNMLGKILCRVRDELAKEEESRQAAKDTVKVLVVVDMQNDFVTGSLGSNEARDIVQNVKNKVEEYVDNHDKVLFTQDTHTEQYLTTYEGKHLPVVHCVYGTEGWEVIPEIAEYQIPYNELNTGNTFHKHTFGSVELAEEIRKLAAEAHNQKKAFLVEFIGVCTDICVVSNVLLAKAHYSDMKIVVDASCCAGVTPEKHKAALETMKSCQIEVVGE